MLVRSFRSSILNEMQIILELFASQHEGSSSIDVFTARYSHTIQLRVYALLALIIVTTAMCK